MVIRPHFLEYTPVPAPAQLMATASAGGTGGLVFPYAFPGVFGAAEGTPQEEESEWVPVNEAAESKVLLPCRMQPISNGQTQNVMKTEDGNVVAFSDYIFLAQDAPEVPFGALVRVYADKDKGKELGVRTVKRFHRGQLHAKIWV